MVHILNEKKAYTYEDYLKTNDDEKLEVLEGNLEMVPAPSTDHQDVQSYLGRLILNYVIERKMGKIYLSPTDIILDLNNIVQPDILFISNEKKHLIQKKGIFGSPDLIIEIISPSSKYRDTYTKKALYEKFRIQEYWLVDPYMKGIEILRLNSEQIYELYSSGYLEDEEQKALVRSSVLNTLEIDLKDIFT